MELSQDKRNGILVVTIAGRLDALTAPDAEKALLAHLEAGETKLVVDAGKLDYISSAGIRVLLMAAKKAARAPGGRFAVAAPTAVVRKILVDSGLEACLGVVATVTEATG